MTYFSSFDISETYSFDYSSNNFPKEKSLPHRSGLLLFGIQFNDILLPQTSSILINPSNYTIKKDDIGFVVAYDIKNAKEISNYTENDSQHNCYNKNMEFFKKANSDEKAPKALEVMAMKLDSQLKDWRIKKEKFLNRAIKTSIDNQMIEIPTIYNLYEENGPKGIFENHVIVRGTIARFRHIAMVIRSYSERPIILFSEDKANLSEWVKFQDVFRNIYYVYGSPTKIKHIIQLDPKKAFKILILSSSNNNFFMDSESIVFTRIISDFFGLKNFLTEITEETNMRYISVNPRHQNNNYLLWPYFVRGSIHFSSLAMSIIAKSLNNKNWVSLIKNITKPPSNYKKDKEFNQNSTLNTLTLTAEGKKEFQFFGHLQYILMSNNPSVIAIAILKTGNTENNQQRATLLKNVSMSGSPTMREKKITSTLTKMMENFYGSEFLMTNPSALMPLREGDKILVIGNIKNDNENYFKKTINSSFRIDTQAGGADKRTEKPLHKNSAENLYNYMAAPDYESKNIAGIKEKIGDTVREFNELLGLLLKNN